MQARRAEELLVQRVTDGLSETEAAELTALGADADLDFDRTVAELDLAMTRPVEHLPPQVLRRILSSASSTPPDAAAATATTKPASESPPRRRRSETLAWAMATAGFAFAAGTLLWANYHGRAVEDGAPTATPIAPSVEQARLRLLEAPDVETIRWTATKDPAGQDARGDVVWSAARQEGYMRFAGLAANDPTQAQYQLWIFDKNRGDKFPVDGGVFDVKAAGPAGETIVRIKPELRISDATLFAVTLEQPGGVVVSKRDRIVVTATPKG